MDTSAYSHARLGHKGMRAIMAKADRIVTNPIVLGELRAGCARGVRKQANEDELQRFLSSERVEVVSIGQETSEYYAVIQASLREAGTPIPTNNAWIAASAMQHGLHVVTFDTHFHNIRQVIVHFLD